MRWTDAYLGLVAATFGFGAVVLEAEGVAWFRGPAPLGGVAAVLLALVALRALGPGSRRVLLVGEPRGRPLYRLREALDDAGFAVRSCPGPERRPCPALAGEPCPVHCRPVAALVCAHESGPELPCSAALGVAGLTLSTESGAGASIADARESVGGRAGPAGVVAALRSVVGGSPPAA